MKTVEIIERIEGEAQLRLQWENEIVKNAQIEFLNFRGFEYILENKPILDALVYNPRICGICGQAHLLATVNAIENLYKSAKVKLEVTTKAKLIRELGLNIENMDSHIKWFYMFIMPDIITLSNKEYEEFMPLKGERWLEAQECTSELIKSLAIIGGQWPHTSYMIPGGVMCDPTHLDIVMIRNYIQQTITFMEKKVIGINFEKYLTFSKSSDLHLLKGDIKEFINISFENSLEKIGKSYKNYLCLSKNNNFEKGRVSNNKFVNSIDLSKIEESTEFTFEVEQSLNTSKKYGWSKGVNYRNEFYETGPLSRTIISKREFITAIHEEYEDSVLTRVLARIDEVIHTLNSSLEIIDSIDLNELSYIKPKVDLNSFSNIKGIGTCEAARGSLLHEISVENGIIQKYNVVTPTVWNLGPGSLEKPGIAQKALIGLNSQKEAEIVLRSFDVCSVCTTH